MRGRRAKPAALRLVEPGQRDPVSHRRVATQPAVVAGEPPRPAYMRGIAAAEWRRLCDLMLEAKTLTTRDGPALEVVCLAYAQMRSAMKEQRHGAAAEAWKRYLNGLGHLGLTPAMRHKAQPVEDGGGGALGEFLRKARA